MCPTMGTEIIFSATAGTITNSQEDGCEASRASMKIAGRFLVCLCLCINVQLAGGMPNLITQRQTVRALCQDPGGNCFCSIRDSREDDYGDISPYYIENFGPYGTGDGEDEEEEEVVENEVTTFNSIPPSDSVFDKLNALRKYWQQPWAAEEESDDDSNTTETAADLVCRTRCSTNVTALSVCAPFVNYKYCARKMNDNATNIENDVLKSYVYTKYLDTVAEACASSTIWKERDGNLHAKTSDCMNAVLAGACYMLFPKCSAEDESPLPICRSQCQNERLSCRRMGSNFGTWNEIRDACAAEPFFDEAAPSDLCTGASIPCFNMSAFCVFSALLVLFSLLT